MLIANWFRVAPLCLLVLGIFASTAQLYAKTPSGTVITNQAEISWFDTAVGEVKTAYSNVSSVVVAKQYDLLLESDNTRNTTVGKKVDLPHRLTNLGNTASEFEVRVRHNLGDSGDLGTTKIYTDSNGNGVSDPGEPEWPATACIPTEPNVSCYKVGTLQPGENHEFSLTGYTPTNAQTGDNYWMNVRAFPWIYDQIISGSDLSSPNPVRVTSPAFEAAIAVSDLPSNWVVNDIVGIIDGAILTVTKNATPGCGVPVKAGESIKYQIGFTNIGDELPVSKLVTIDGVDFTGVILEDVIPPNVSLEKIPMPISAPNQSIILVQVVADEDTNRWTRFNTWNGTDVISKIGLLIPAAQMQPNQSGNLSFDVTVNQNVTTSVVYNQATFDLAGGSEPEFVSNRVCTNIEPANTREGGGSNPDRSSDATIRFLTPVLSIKQHITQNGGVPDFFNDAHFEDAEFYRMDNSLSNYDVNRDGVYIEMRSSAVNADEDTVDRIEVTVSSATGDTLKVMLVETGPNTNVFRSIHQIRMSDDEDGAGRSCPATSTVPNYAANEPNCVLNGDPDGNLTVVATVSLGAGPVSILKDAALIDPLGIVFDSAYNTPVEGATVWIRNENGSVALDPLSGSPYAPQVTSADGRYQFPYLYPNQNYYLDVVPPVKYTFPSVVPKANFEAPANGPKREVNDFSYGKDGFNKTPSGGVFTLTKLLVVDIPLDPELDTDLALIKSASLTEVGVGGTISYTIKIKNHSSQLLYAVKVQDTLPRGFRYVPGSATLNGVAIDDPDGLPGRSLTFTNLPFVDNAADGMLDFLEHSLKYSVRTTAGAVGSAGVNSAFGYGKTPTGVPITSNVAKVRVKIKREGVLSDSGIIFGKVFVDADCNNVQNGGEWPIGGVKLYLEDGTWVITDANGQFSLYGLGSSSHVIKMDPITLPKGIVFKPTDNRQMADPNSRLVDLKPGEFHRADFAAICPKENTQEIFDEIKARNTGQTDWMLKNAQKYDPSQDSTAGDMTKSADGGGDISSGSEKNSVQKFAKTKAQSLTVGYSIQTAQFVERELAVSALEGLPKHVKNESYVHQVGDFYTVRIGFDLSKKAVKSRLRQGKLNKGAKVVPTIYEQLSDDVADRLESPRGLAVMTPAKEAVKSVTNKQAKSGAWLWPSSDTSMDGRFMVVVRKGLTPTLMVNGKEVPKSQMGEQIENRREKAQVVAWYGVKLDPGANKVEVVGKDMFGNKRVLAKGDFNRPVSAHRMTVTSETKQLPADGGRSYLPVTIKLLDKNGYLARGVNFVTIEASDGQWVERDIQSQNQGRQVRVVNGLRVVNLRSSERSGKVHIRVSDGSMNDELSIDQIAPLRPLIAVGLIEIGGHMFNRASNSPFSTEKDYEARAAGFMKGRIRGDMHLTLSVDTAKKEDATLFRDINPNKSYPIHGDSSQRGYEAQSRSKVYVKLEKDLDSIMWGDFVTDGSTINEDVTRVQRSLTGANLISKRGASELQVFVSQLDEERVVEKIRGKGVALNYKLTSVPLVPNSETIEIITVSRDNPGIVLNTKTLTRFGDYTLDSVTGELSFSETVPTSDANLNPVQIRASYDVEATASVDDYTVAGVRAKYAIKPDLKVGMSYTVDQHKTKGFEVYGATVDYKSDEGLIARGSVGQYKPMDTTKKTGVAGRLYVSKEWEDKSTTSISLGRATKGFSNAAAGIAEEREELRIKHDLKVYQGVGAEIEALHSKNLATNDTERSLGLTSNMKVKDWTVKGGVRHIEQSKSTGDESFQTFIVGAKKAVTVVGRNGSVEGEYEQDFNSTQRRRMALTADMEVHDKVKVYARGERINSLSGVSGLSSSAGAQDTFSVGVKSNLLPSTELFSEYRVRGGISGRDLETASGIRGTYELRKGLSVSPHLEIVNNLKGSGNDSISASVAYKDSRFADRISALRLETRHDDNREYYGLQADYVKRLSSSWSALFKDSLRYESPNTGNDLMDNTLTLGLAHRPRRDNQKNGVFFYQNKEERGGSNGDCSTHILSTHQNYEIKDDVLVSGRLGGKVEDCNGSKSDATILDGRITWDITKRLDVDVHGGVLGTNGLKEKNYSVGLGANYLIRENLRAGIGYNIKGFKDDDLDPDSYNDKGVYFGLKYKFDENGLNWLTGEK